MNKEETSEFVDRGHFIFKLSEYQSEICEVFIQEEATKTVITLH